MTTYGYIRTSRQRIEGSAGSDPEAQAHQLHQDGVPEANVFRDVGVSGGTGTNSRTGWRALDAKLAAGDTLVVVAIDRIGRRWMDTVNTVRGPARQGGQDQVPGPIGSRLGHLPRRRPGHSRGGHWRYSDHLHGMGCGAGTAGG